MASMKTSRLTREEIAEALKAEPLVGAKGAARIVGVKAPNFRRDVAPHLLSIPVEGSAAAALYFRSEVQEFGAGRRPRRDAAAAQNGARAAA